MTKFNLIAPCIFGVEGILADELRRIGAEDHRLEDSWLGLLRDLLDSEHRPLPCTPLDWYGTRCYGHLCGSDGHLLVVWRAGLHHELLPQD